MKAQECLYFSLLPITVLVETFILRPKYSMFGLSTNRSFKKKKKKGKEMLQPPSGAGWHLFISFITKPARAK